MGRIAFVFPGQGDQYPGMGREIYDRFEEAERVYDICDRIRPGTSEQCFFGGADELKDTANTQPCLFATELAYAEVLKAHRILPDTVAGLSLGEVAACAFAGVFDLEQGLALAARRGQLMKEASDGQPSFMAAVLRLDRPVLEEICRTVHGVYAVNFNAPGQVTIAGHSEMKDAVGRKIKEAGGRMVPLQVSGAFHSPFMEPASIRFRELLYGVPVRQPGLETYSNVTGLPYQGDPRELLARQIMSPVLWEDSVRNMIRAGVDTFIETGPGKTLSGLIRRIDRNVRTYDMSDMQRILDEVRIC